MFTTMPGAGAGAGVGVDARAARRVLDPAVAVRRQRRRARRCPAPRRRATTGSTTIFVPAGTCATIQSRVSVARVRRATSTSPIVHASRRAPARTERDAPTSARSVGRSARRARRGARASASAHGRRRGEQADEREDRQQPAPEVALLRAHEQRGTGAAPGRAREPARASRTASSATAPPSAASAGTQPSPQVERPQVVEPARCPA